MSVLAAVALSACKAKEEPPVPPRINKKFARSDADRVVAMLIQQVCAATGGPCTYTGRSMKEAHTNMGVTEGEFDALVEDLVTTLDQFTVPAQEKQELLTALGTMKSDVVETPGAATGTALPQGLRAVEKTVTQA